LLHDDLRQPDEVWILCIPPGKIPFVFLIPGKELKREGHEDLVRMAKVGGKEMAKWRNGEIAKYEIFGNISLCFKKSIYLQPVT
jgi:hypothetical protein